MRASEVITRLQNLMRESGKDPYVTAQSSGCCAHGHEVIEIEVDIREGMDRYECTPYNTERFDDRSPDLILRCS